MLKLYKQTLGVVLIVGLAWSARSFLSERAILEDMVTSISTVIALLEDYLPQVMSICEGHHYCLRDGQCYAGC